VVLITHTLPDVIDVADRVEVLRFGRRTATFDRDDATVELLVSAITGVYSNVAVEAPLDITELDVAGGGR
jgi:simple sugar transport system ATP-binding protein